VVRPVVGFRTDFGSDSAAAICRGVILSIVPDVQIVDIDHAVRKFAIRDGAFLLWATLPWLPIGTHLGVVDPGVGTDRRPIALRVRRGDVLVGPDNGLLMPAAERLGGITEARLLENRGLMLEHRSATFHGRDVFAPVAAHLAAGTEFGEVGPTLELTELVGLAFPAPRRVGAELLVEVLYADSFGNLRLSARPSDLPSAIEPGRAPAHPDELRFELSIGAGTDALPAPLLTTFGAVQPGEMLLYEDSNGWLAVGINQGSAAATLGIGSGGSLRIRPQPV
jgi:S-adenosylmethionine hydrolase